MSIFKKKMPPSNLIELPKRLAKTDRSRRVIALAVTIALVLCVLIAVVFHDHLNLTAIKRWMSTRDISTSQTGEGTPFPYVSGSRQSAACLDDGVLFASDGGAHYYSFTGVTYAEEICSFVNPVINVNRTCGVIYDVGEKNLYQFQKGTETFSLSSEGEGNLLSARVNESGWLAVTTQESGYKGSVTVYDNNHEKVINISLSSAFLVDAAISPDCKTVAIITMGQSEGTFQSRLLFYPVDAKEPSDQVSLGNTMVLDMEYEGGNLWIVGEESLTIVSAGTKTSTTYSYDRNYLKGCSLNGNGFALLLLGHYRAGSASQVVVVNSSGAASVQDLTTQVLSFSAAGRYFSLLTGDTLTVYTPDLTEYAKLDDTKSARYTALSPDGTCVLADQQQAWLYLP